MIRRLAAPLALLAFAAPSWAAPCQFFPGGASNYQVASPPQVVQLANGHFIMGDTFFNRLVEQTEGGTNLTTYGPSVPGHGALNEPAGVAVDPAGHIYVADRQNNRIIKFDSSMAPMMEWATSAGGHPNNLTLSPDGTVLYVAEQLGNRVSMYTTGGAFLGSWGTGGSGPGQFNQPFGIATDVTGNVYVSDYGNNRVEVFSPSGTYVGTVRFSV
ncbi:MAG: SMP-30/gluconolactonase/LRE family protein [Candidatus Eisenbacteria bacterium]|nr:SMP-30/gluconolactonase/LRE family protein [Candidatus Eisenbacteria bacterium]